MTSTLHTLRYGHYNAILPPLLWSEQTKLVKVLSVRLPLQNFDCCFSCQTFWQSTIIFSIESDTRHTNGSINTNSVQWQIRESPQLQFFVLFDKRFSNQSEFFFPCLKFCLDAGIGFQLELDVFWIWEGRETLSFICQSPDWLLAVAVQLWVFTIVPSTLYPFIIKHISRPTHLNKSITPFQFNNNVISLLNFNQKIFTFRDVDRQVGGGSLVWVT